MQAPGAVIERMVFLVPRALLISRSASIVHSGIVQPDGSPPARLSAGLRLASHFML